MTAQGVINLVLGLMMSVRIYAKGIWTIMTSHTDRFDLLTFIIVMVGFIIYIVDWTVESNTSPRNNLLLRIAYATRSIRVIHAVTCAEQIMQRYLRKSKG